MATPSQFRRRQTRNASDTSSGQVVDATLSRVDISKPYGRLALRSSRKHFVRQILASMEDGATEVPRIHVKAQLCLSVLVILASVGILVLAARVREGDSYINRFGDTIRPCPRNLPRGRNECYQGVDIDGHVIYTRDHRGFHFEMNPNCSSRAPEDDTMKCRGEWSFAREDEVVWYLRRYVNVTSGASSLVSLPSLKDDSVRMVAMRWIPRPDDPTRATWVFSSASIPRNDFPEVELVIDGTAVVGQMVVESSK